MIPAVLAITVKQPCPSVSRVVTCAPETARETNLVFWIFSEATYIIFSKILP